MYILEFQLLIIILRKPFIHQDIVYKNLPSTFVCVKQITYICWKELLQQ